MNGRDWAPDLFPQRPGRWKTNYSSNQASCAARIGFEQKEVRFHFAAQCDASRPWIREEFFNAIARGFQCSPLSGEFYKFVQERGAIGKQRGVSLGSNLKPGP